MNDDHTNADLPPPNFGFVKMIRSPDILELIETWPLAFALAAIIALRARYRPGVSLKGLQPGEALLGDFTRYGMTEQQYRTCKKQLTKWNFATFKPTPKGTVARLMDTRLFDVLNVAANGQSNGQPTDSQRLTKKVKNGKKEKKTTKTGVSQAQRPFERFPKSGEAIIEFAKQHDIPDATVLRFVRYNNSRQWPLNDWHSALLAFQDACDESSGGVSSVPSNWRPEIVPPEMEGA